MAQHFHSVEEFRQFVESGFQEVKERVKPTHTQPRAITPQQIKAMTSTSQTRKELALLQHVQRDHRLAAQVEQDTRHAVALAGARASSSLPPSKALSIEMRKRRIVQVREQEKLLAASTHRQRRHLQDQVRADLDLAAQQQWQRSQASRKEALRRKYTQALTSVGGAQKSAVVVQSDLRTSAREQLGAWHSTDQQHQALHRRAVKEARAHVRPHQQRALRSELRDRARTDESDRQREEARRYQAILQAATAANEHVAQERLRLDYRYMGMDRRVETAVYDHGGGATDFSTTRVHHRVVRHQVKSVFVVHVGGTRCVTSSTDHYMNIHARITLSVECIRTFIFILLFYV